MQANILIFLESNYRSSLAKTVPLPLLPIEEIGISLGSGLMKLFFYYYAGFLCCRTKFIAPIGAGIPI
jgi:hypothetical protein